MCSRRHGFAPRGPVARGCRPAVVFSQRLSSKWRNARNVSIEPTNDSHTMAFRRAAGPWLAVAAMMLFCVCASAAATGHPGQAAGPPRGVAPPPSLERQARAVCPNKGATRETVEGKVRCVCGANKVCSPNNADGSYADKPCNVSVVDGTRRSVWAPSECAGCRCYDIPKTVKGTGLLQVLRYPSISKPSRQFYEGACNNFGGVQESLLGKYHKNAKYDLVYNKCVCMPPFTQCKKHKEDPGILWGVLDWLKVLPHPDNLGNIRNPCKRFAVPLPGGGTETRQGFSVPSDMDAYTAGNCVRPPTTKPPPTKVEIDTATLRQKHACGGCDSQSGKSTDPKTSGECAHRMTLGLKVNICVPGDVRHTSITDLTLALTCKNGYTRCSGVPTTSAAPPPTTAAVTTSGIQASTATAEPVLSKAQAGDCALADGTIAVPDKASNDYLFKTIDFKVEGEDDCRAACAKLIEAGKPWPKACLHAMVRYLEKEGSKVGEVMSFRPLTITVPIYRRWPSIRLKPLGGWIDEWALEEMFAGFDKLE